METMTRKRRAEEYEERVREYLKENKNQDLNIRWVINGFPTFREIPYRLEKDEFTTSIELFYSEVLFILENGKMIPYYELSPRSVAMEIVLKTGHYRDLFKEKYGVLSEENLEKNALKLILQRNMLTLLHNKKKAYFRKKENDSVYNLWKIAVDYSAQLKEYTLIEKVY